MRRAILVTGAVSVTVLLVAQLRLSGFTSPRGDEYKIDGAPPQAASSVQPQPPAEANAPDVVHEAVPPVVAQRNLRFRAPSVPTPALDALSFRKCGTGRAYAGACGLIRAISGLATEGCFLARAAFLDERCARSRPAACA